MPDDLSVGGFHLDTNYDRVKSPRKPATSEDGKKHSPSKEQQQPHRDASPAHDGIGDNIDLEA